MNRRSKCGSAIIKRLPFHIQMYPLSSQTIKRRLESMEKKYYRNPALNYKKNSFIRLQLETNSYLCYHCHTPIIPDRLNVSNRKNIYHLKCAILINMVCNEIVVEREREREPPRETPLPDL